MTDLVAGHPELADQLLEIIPALVELEQLGDSTGSYPGPRADGLTAPESGRPGSLGEYKILRRIGSGGMGEVFEAEHQSLKSRVALKVMHPRFRAEAKYLRRFHIEARSAAGLHHTNIVSAFDYGQQAGVRFYAMQYIRGQPLDLVLADLRRLSAANKVAEAAEDGGAAGPTSTVSQRSAARSFLTGRLGSGADGSIESTFSSRGDRPKKPGGDESSGPRKPPSIGSASLGGPVEARYYRQVARICAQVADALDYAHRAAVLHRDIKSE